MEELSLEVNITIYKQRTGERLSISDRIDIPSYNFLQMCEILGKFQTLADSYKKHE